jgi:hypothetical protein
MEGRWKAWMAKWGQIDFSLSGRCWAQACKSGTFQLQELNYWIENERFGKLEVLGIEVRVPLGHWMEK